MDGQGELVSICRGEAAVWTAAPGAKPRSAQTTPHDPQICRAVGGPTGADNWKSKGGSRSRDSWKALRMKASVSWMSLTTQPNQMPKNRTKSDQPLKWPIKSLCENKSNRVSLHLYQSLSTPKYPPIARNEQNKGFLCQNCNLIQRNRRNQSISS